MNMLCVYAHEGPQSEVGSCALHYMTQMLISFLLLHISLQTVKCLYFMTAKPLINALRVSGRMCHVFATTFGLAGTG